VRPKIGPLAVPYVGGLCVVRQPVESGISKWFCWHVSQGVCPWNEKFALPLREDAFRPREVLVGKDARTLARELLEMSDEEFRIAFKGSPMKRAKLTGLKRNAAVVFGNSCSSAGDCPIPIGTAGSIAHHA
jgi:hypothetical protein